MINRNGDENMSIIEQIKEKVKGKRMNIILPEANDVRIIEATAIICKEGFADITLIGKKADIDQLADDYDYDVTKAKIIDPEEFEDTGKLINEFFELRKKKGVSLEDATKIIKTDYMYFACMLVKLGYADGVVSGARHSSADTLRPALQIVKAAPDSKIVSSFFLMEVPDCKYGSNGVFVFSDCGMIQNPTDEQLVEIGYSSANTFELLTDEMPNVAFLSHSSYGSSKCEDVYKVQRAVEMAKERYPEINLDGELQLDAAIIQDIGRAKAPSSPVAGKANVLIFPDLDAGNIGYKLVERLAKAKAYGPITQGIAKPINDLSRGCNAQDVVGAVAITALQALK